MACSLPKLRERKMKPVPKRLLENPRISLRVESFDPSSTNRNR